MKKLTNTESELKKKNEAYKKSFQVISFRCLQVTCRTTERSVILKDVF